MSKSTETKKPVPMKVLGLATIGIFAGALFILPWLTTATSSSQDFAPAFVGPSWFEAPDFGSSNSEAERRTSSSSSSNVDSIASARSHDPQQLQSLPC